MSEHPQVIIAEGIATVTLNRAEKHNALQAEQFFRLREVAKALSANAEVKVVLLNGAGPSFCSGLDVVSIAQDPSAIERLIEKPEQGPAASVIQDAVFQWSQIEKPVIAALHGNVFGAGLQLALACDIRIADPKAKLAFKEIDIGLIPDLALSYTLRQLVPKDVVAEMIFSGAVLDGRAAERKNLVTRLSEQALNEAQSLAADLASKSPQALAAAKKLLMQWHEPYPELLEEELRLQKTLLGSAEQMAIMMKKVQSLG